MNKLWSGAILKTNMIKWPNDSNRNSNHNLDLGFYKPEILHQKIFQSGELKNILMSMNCCY